MFYSILGLIQTKMPVCVVKLCKKNTSKNKKDTGITYHQNHIKMVQLFGNNLCKRQKELNHLVNKAFANNVDFNEIKAAAEPSDVDKLYKIDLASKYKNIHYIIEVLKSGDDLCISRALKKCVWLYDKDYSNVINMDYLHHNVFPFMSVKMKKKLLSAVSTNLKDENRAEDFYKYCLCVKFGNLADKFLFATSESFKLSCIQNNVAENDLKYLKRLTGNSFELLEAYLERQSEWNRNILVREYRHLYSVSDVKYLDLLEKHAKPDPSCWKEMGLRMSKDIITKHRARVLKSPKFYVTLLNRSKLVRHSNAENAKIYVVSRMPKDAAGFWNVRFYKTYKSIIDIIPQEERYAFLKKTFADHYPSEEFDTNKFFYDQHYYNLMSLPEQEDWALRQIASGKEMLGTGRDYMWYKFVCFEKASIELKQYIKVATDHTKRSELIKVLIESAKNQRELQQLFKYYYERHVNESRNNKENFMKKIISCHKVLEFDDNCWSAFDKLLHSLEVYNMLGHASNPDFKVVSILYHILNKKQLPNALEEYLDKNMSSYSFKSHVEDLGDKEKQTVYDFISNFYLRKIESVTPISQEPAELEKVKSNVTLYIHYLLEFMAMYKKTQRDIPEIVMKYVNLDWNSYKYQQILEERNTARQTISQQQLLKYLKEDASILVVKLKDVKTAVRSSGYFRIKTLLKKLRIYFDDDIAREYITFFQELLHEKNLYNSLAASAVFAIFQLGDESTKLEFMIKYAPEIGKIDHNNIDSALLNVQECICRFACYSRPPVPLSTMLLYLKGDYVRYCLPMFHMYLANLPQPLCIKFVESLIDAPISIQKHGLRLAFKCFNADNLTKLVLDSWKKTKNVSLRSVIYKAFYNKNVEEDARELFDVLKTLTLDLNEHDDDDLFHILTSNKLSQQFVGEFLEVVWGTVQKFSNNDTNLQRKTNVIRCIDNNLNLIKKSVIKGVIDEQVKTLFDENEAEVKESVAYFITAKWELIAHYIVFFTNSETERKEGVALAKSILEKCINKWNDVHKDCYIYRRVCLDFIKTLDQKGYNYNDVVNYENANCIFEAILEELISSLPVHEIYTLLWKLRIKIITRKLIDAGRQQCNDLNKLEVVIGTAKKLGIELGNLVKEFIEKKMYYSYILNEILELIDNDTRNFELFISSGIDLKHDDVLVAVAGGLVELSLPETHSIALQLLPLNPDEDCNLVAYKQVLEAIRLKANSEIKSCMYSKYYGDCKRRRFL